MKTTIEGKLSYTNQAYIEIEQINEHHDTNYVHLDETDIENLLEKLTELVKLKNETHEQNRLPG